MYYKLILENGHVGSGKSLEIVRYLKGESFLDMYEAAAGMPRVKGRKMGTGIKLVQSVTREEYIEGMRQAASDPYLNTRKKKRTRRERDVFFH